MDFNFGNIAKNVLAESLPDIVYHYTTIEGALSIITNDAYNLQFSDVSGGAHKVMQDLKRRFYMCVTRDKSNRYGYSYMRFKKNAVRISLDGRSLGATLKAKPVTGEAYYDNNEKPIGNKKEKLVNYRPDADELSQDLEFYKDENGGSTSLNDKFFNPEAQHAGKNENEERIFSDKSVIKNFTKYITRIDILIPSANDESWQKRNNAYESGYDDSLYYAFEILKSNVGNITYVYDNGKAFNYDKEGKKCINQYVLDYFSDEEYYPEEASDPSKEIQRMLFIKRPLENEFISNIINNFLGDYKDTISDLDYANFAMQMFKHYGVNVTIPASWAAKYRNSELTDDNIYGTMHGFSKLPNMGKSTLLKMYSDSIRRSNGIYGKMLKNNTR